MDSCPYANSEKLYDLVFFVRVSEKGIFDYLKVIVLLVKRGEKIKAILVGFAEDGMSAKVRKKTAGLGISRHVKFRFNAPR